MKEKSNTYILFIRVRVLFFGRRRRLELKMLLKEVNYLLRTHTPVSRVFHRPQHFFVVLVLILYVDHPLPITLLILGNPHHLFLIHSFLRYSDLL